MRTTGLCTGFLLLLPLAAPAFGQGYEMTIHLSDGSTVTIPHSEILRIEFPGGATGVETPGDAPQAFQLLRNFPNPFNPSTTIAYTIAEPAAVRVRIVDARGALIKELLAATQPAGRHEVVWNGTDAKGLPVASGVYLCAVDCDEKTLSQQLILVK